MTKPKPRSPFVYMGLGISTEKRGFYDNSFRVKIVSTPPCKNRKQKVLSSLSNRLLLWAPPQVERGGCMQGNGLEKEPWAHLPLLALFRAYSHCFETREEQMSLRLPCKIFRAAGWLSVIRSTIYSMVIAPRMLVAAL